MVECVEEPYEEQHEGKEPESFWTHPALVLVVGCLSALAVVGIAVTLVFIVNQRQYTDCQRQHNDETIAALSERAKAGNTDRDALRQITQSTTEMIKVILEPQATQADKITAIEHWRDEQETAKQKLADADAQREAHPLPEPRHC